MWHRDIKPENILLDAAGRVKIADFGIARIVGDPLRDFTLTRTGNALGSAAYMAPEQHEKPHEVDHRADIYSLGVVIYEMLTGELPLGRFPAPSRKAEVNARIDEIVLRTLEKERELRQQSAGEVKTDVQGAASAKTLIEVPVKQSHRQRHGKLAFGLFLVGVLGSPVLSGFLGGGEVVFLCGAALLMALILGIMSWRERLAKFAAIAAGGLLAISISLYIRQRTALHRPLTQASQAALVADENAVPKQSDREWKLDAESLEKLSHVGDTEAWFPWGGYIKNGDAQRMRGDLAGALQNYRNSAACFEKPELRLAWLRQLAESHAKIGDVLSQQGDLAGALENYRTAVAAHDHEEIVKRDPMNPKNARLEDDLIVLHVKIGDILSRQGDRAAALRSYRKGVAVEEKDLPDDWGQLDAKPFQPDELTRLAAPAPDSDDSDRSLTLANLIYQAGVEKDVRFRYLLDLAGLRRDPNVDLALASYDYSVNGNPKALDYLLTKLAAEQVGSDASEVGALGEIDEWKRSTDAVQSHFAATDGAGGDCKRDFWETRQFRFPRNYLAFRGKAGDGAPVPVDEKAEKPQ